MQQEVILHFGAQDWRDARGLGFENAIAHLLSCQTGSWWRFSACGVGVEILPPHRSCQVYGYEALHKFVMAEARGWDARVRVAIFDSVGPVPPFALSVEVITPSGESVEVPLDGLVTLASRFLHSGAVENGDHAPVIGDKPHFP